VNAVWYDVALTAYIAATALALTFLGTRRDVFWRLGVLVTEAGWVCHTVSLVLRWVELGRPPFLTLPEAVSVVIWAAVLLELWAERQYQMKTLGAFVLPVVVMMGLALPTGLRGFVLVPRIRSAWISVHVILALLGLGALVLNFAGAVMFVLQERQLKTKRQGAVYYRLPSLEALDRLTYRALIIGFPFLTVGLLLGFLWPGDGASAGFRTDPLTLLSVAMWVVYALTLWGRVAGTWRGRRAAYFAILGFCALLLSLGAGVLYHGRHGA
jgi:ABC-type uncharacterized transport system permease subunit